MNPRRTLTLLVVLLLLLLAGLAQAQGPDSLDEPADSTPIGVEIWQDPASVASEAA